eukprot:TRINITY_DN24423_c0_g1_i1.p1 TRINITY_DN24423_c0_g1~~TRINITY_DN24423_c0_g1_i1.p1  ORF type:complete len:334 (+),score=40.52 TRINITY_DN24423_c0_g1_i1:42-1043(+)
MKEPSAPETWKAFFVVGVVFPLHIVLGVLSVPTLLFYLVKGSYVAWVCTALYLPFYLWPAQKRYPGWKGFEALWRFMDYTNTCKSYFGDFAVHGSDRIDGKQQYFVACHPHGTLIFSRMFWRSSLLENVFQRPWYMLGVSAVFRIPIMRELSLWFGATDSGRSNCERLLRAGANVVVFPGGLDEANSVDGPTQVRVRTRTGFIRLAVKHGTPVLPMFVFGELDAVKALSPLPRQVAHFFQKRLRISTNMFAGRYLLMPHRVPFNLCVGSAVNVTQCTDETALEQEVARVHSAYKAELRALYEANKDRFGYGKRELVFVCEQSDCGNLQKAKRQ